MFYPFNKSFTPAVLNKLYIRGGYHSIPDGCVPWGSSLESKSRFIGDTMGHIVLKYTDAVQKIPLIFGYTLWFKAMWNENCAPFRTDPQQECVGALKDALCLYGAFEGCQQCWLAITPLKKTLESISIEANPQKEGCPVFDGFCTAAEDFPEIQQSGDFFSTHTINADAPYPQKISDAIDKINKRLLTFESDFSNPTCGEETGFSGDADARIASAVLTVNLKELGDRVDNDGFVHTSARQAPTWWYNGFGTWLPNAGVYYGDYYSRDAGRALMTLTAFGDREAARRGLKCGNGYIMFFPDNNITFMGKPVPGHCTVTLNNPMFYPETLTALGWPTLYKKERFGEDYKNLGNQETDGHGLMMLANYSFWRVSSDRKAWAEQNWPEIKEYAEWIIWCFENSDASLVQNGLLYAESEAAMNSYSLYCNVPCCLGLYGFALIAESISRDEYSLRWRAAADALRTAITGHLSEDGKWKKESFGFYHDPTMTFCADFYGYDVSDMPREWTAISKNTYKQDVSAALALPYDASGGVGYNTAMITQNALLQDMTSDADTLVRRLTRLCYAPALPEPCSVPEGASYSVRMKAVRRQGDLGNLVQLSEVLKTYAIIYGVSVHGDECKIMPRLPHGWSINLQDFKVGMEGTLNLNAEYPVDGKQSMKLMLKNTDDIKTVSVRFGPFKKDEGTELHLNGASVSGKKYFSGDSFWEWVTLPAKEIRQDE